LIGTQQVAWLHFNTVSNQSSAFVALRLDNTVGYQADGTEVRNFAPQSGRLVIIGAEPLLEAVFNANRAPTLILYGPPGFNYEVQTHPQFDAPREMWQPYWQGPLEDLFRSLPLNAGANRTLFFRAKREP
jgi:hypothetical protein